MGKILSVLWFSVALAVVQVSVTHAADEAQTDRKADQGAGNGDKDKKAVTEGSKKNDAGAEPGCN